MEGVEYVMAGAGILHRVYVQMYACTYTSHNCHTYTHTCSLSLSSPYLHMPCMLAYISSMRACATSASMRMHNNKMRYYICIYMCAQQDYIETYKLVTMPIHTHGIRTTCIQRAYGYTPYNIEAAIAIIGIDV
jgi:hypothetical protein